MLYDKNFLLELDKEKNKTIYAKIIALNVEESPVETIEGRVTQGSINIDGASAVRRTCSLTLVAQDFDYSDYVWGMNTKFKLEIGVENNINSNYPNIIWFNQGIYIITSFNTSRSTNNFTITLQGKDKMCLLNGDIGGTIGVQTDFGTIEEEDSEGTWTIRPIPIPEIIRNIVHVYGGEPYHNIIIKDLDSQGLELLEYRYENMPLILYRKKDAFTYTNPLFMTDDYFFYRQPNKREKVYLNEIKDDEFEQLVDSIGYTVTPKVFYDEFNNEYYLTKIKYGDAAGFRTTELTYAGDLIANVGESVTSVLDKIKNMLVEFEYFYDIDGHFIFQKKQSFIQTLWSASEDGNEDIKTGLALSSTSAYTFSGGELITAFNNSPNLLNLRNDFSIWGERTSVSGAKIPIHLRYALDVKPVRYTTIELDDFSCQEVTDYNTQYGTTLPVDRTAITYSIKPNYNQKTNYFYVTDWREVLYRMAQDYYKSNMLSNFEIQVRTWNPDDYPLGKTHYEQYYTDIQVCWRQLYNPELGKKIEALEKEVIDLQELIPQYVKDLKVVENSIVAENNLLANKNNSQEVNNEISLRLLSLRQEKTRLSNEKSQAEYLLEQKSEDLEKYKDDIENYYQMEELYPENLAKLKNVKRNLLCPISDSIITVITRNNEQFFKIPFNVIESRYTDDENKNEVLISSGDIVYSYEDEAYFKIVRIEDDFALCEPFSPDRLYWNKSVFLNPGALNYWFDFLDTEGELNQFSVRAVGARTKAINENTIKSIYFREIPQVIFQEKSEWSSPQMSGYKYIQIPELDKMFTISAQGKSAKERLDELLYAHGYCTESASITAIPIYYLQPNVRVNISDPETNLSGDYIVSKITIPLSHNGTMSLTTTKAAQTIFL